MTQAPTNAVEINGKSSSVPDKATPENSFLSVYKQVLAIGTGSADNKFPEKYIRFTNLMAVNTFFGAILYLLAAAVTDNFYWINATLALIFICMLTVGLNALGQTSVSRTIYLLGFSTSFFLSALFTGASAQVGGFLILAIIIPFLIFDLREKSLVALGILFPLVLIYSFDYLAPYFTSFNLPLSQQVLLYKAGVTVQFALMTIAMYQLLSTMRKTEEQVISLQIVMGAQAKELKRNQTETEQLAYAISHDLRAPVRNITSFMNLLTMKHASALQPEAREFIEYSRTGSKRMERLIEDIVTYYRLGTNLGPASTVKMNDLVTKLKFELNTKIKGAAEAISVSGDLPVVNNVHATLMQQLMQHLISNGLKFNKSEKPEVIIGGTETKGGYSFWIKDNGIGISQQHATAIYLIFKRLHAENEYEGIGTGLAICKKIVEFYHGAIWFESEPGKGTTFHFTLRK
jgi:signal transduction histidine kinase